MIFLLTSVFRKIIQNNRSYAFASDFKYITTIEEYLILNILKNLL